jgi:glutamyl-Q tRNA(Asp) synthetase
VPGAADQIQRQLVACGLEWDGPVVFQSQRDAIYAEAFGRLVAAGHVYPCGCTRASLAQAPRNAEGETRYPGRCRAGLPPGVTHPSWRLRVEEVSTCFEDRVRGTLCQNPAEDVGDFIIRRADGLFAYQLAVVVDDAAQGVTHVVRGADLLWNTPRQILLQRQLGLPTPQYAHLPLVTDADGRKLSKQQQAPALFDNGQALLVARALTILGHPPPSALAAGPLHELLTWACAHWAISRVPAHAAIAIDAA